MLRNKKSIILLIVGIMILSMFPVYAENQTPDISPWAMMEMVDAERYDLFEMDWYFNNFTKTSTLEKTDIIINKVDKKIKSNDIKTLENNLTVKVNDSVTRENFLNKLFNCLSKYDDSINEKTNVIEYFTKNEILKGKGKDLKLKEDITTEEAVLFSKRSIDYIYSKYNLGAKGLLWEVENKGNKIYLLGSVHIGSSDIYPFSESLMEKFDSSSKLFVEANILNPNMEQKTLENLYFQDETTLKDVISKESYKKVQDIMTGFGVNEEVYLKMKPWACALQISNLSMLTGESEVSANHGIDVYFLINAMMKNKEIVELEGVDFQYGLFNSLSMKDQTKMLDDSLEAMLNPNPEKSSNEGLNDMIASWKNADEKAMKSFITFEDENPLNELLLGKRDKEMARKIDLLLQEEGENTYFVVVGAAHYVTDNAVVDTLRDKGYDVKSLNLSK